MFARCYQCYIALGEGFKYADSALEYLLSTYHIPGSQIILSYDINCRFFQHRKECMLTATVTIARSSSPRSTYLGLVLETVKDQKEIGVILANASGPTQRATRGLRELIISDVIDHQSSRHIANFVTNLSKRIENAAKALKSTENWSDYKTVVFENIKRRRDHFQQELFDPKSTKDAQLEALFRNMESEAVGIIRMEQNLKRKAEVPGFGGGTYEATQLKKSIKKSFVSLRKMLATYNSIHRATDNLYDTERLRFANSTNPEEIDDDGDSDDDPNEVSEDEGDVESLEMGDSMQPGKPTMPEEGNTGLLMKDIFERVKNATPLDNSNEVYWRHAEDLYHAKNDLAKFAFYFNWRVNQFWNELSQRITSAFENDPETAYSFLRLFSDLSQEDMLRADAAKAEIEKWFSKISSWTEL
ncbi:hypothetical protein DFJ73DRAFT_946248 [Zopfochytrium polystomum]|nr:hypothetical protein DFJ73DRAFT_946248 [Zopfochytrium polystomum]